MSKLVIIEFGSGDLETGFVNITARLETGTHLKQFSGSLSEQFTGSLSQKFTGSLPPAANLIELYRDWQSTYNNINNRIAIKKDLAIRSGASEEEDDDDFEIDRGGTTNVSDLDLYEPSQELERHFQKWLKSEDFQDLEKRLRTELDPDETFPVIIETKNDLIRKLPWHLWDFIACDYPKAGTVLSRPEYKQVRSQVPTNKNKVRILSVLGYADDLEVEKDWQVLSSLKDEQIQNKPIELVPLSNPSRQELNDQLWDKSGWDILFFSGHSRSEGESGSICLSENENITISQLKYALKKAIENGLKLAIFNSCEGLGLANALSKLNIPGIIVMGEPVSDRVAQQFFKDFMDAFAISQKPLYLAVREARERLQGLEDKYPGVTYLPITFQNPAVEPLTWWKLAEICPYRDLQAFRERDAHLFFGREEVTSELVEEVERRPLVTIIGPSGSGKSSLLFAGIIPQLKQKPAGGWQIASFRPQKKPFRSIVQALAPFLPNKSSINGDRRWEESSINDDRRGEELPIKGDDQRWEESSINGDRRGEELPSLMELKLETGETKLSKLIEQIATPDRPLLIAIDQFEELYTFPPEAKRQPFLDMLVEAVDRANKNQLNFTLILTLRADFLNNCFSYDPFIDILNNAGIIYPLRKMKRLELIAAIEKPASKFGVTLEPGLVEYILSKEEDPDNLPLLEFALTQLWHEQRDFCLSYRAYKKIGGVKTALTNHADRIYLGLTDAEKELAERIFIQLVKPGESTEATRRLATRDELGEKKWKLVRSLADCDSRLVVTNYQESSKEKSTKDKSKMKADAVANNDDESTRIETVELVHEALIKNWGLLSEWLKDYKGFRSWQEGLREIIKQWKSQDKDEGLLLRGKALEEAKKWLKDRKDDLSKTERDYINLSIKFNARQRNIKYASISAFILLSSAIPISWQMLRKPPEIITGNDLITDVSTLENVLKESKREFEIEKNKLGKEYFYEPNKGFNITKLNKIHNYYRERKNEIHNLLAHYRLILRSTINLKKELENDPEKFSSEEENIINNIDKQAEDSFALIVLTFRTPELELHFRDFQHINPNIRERTIDEAKQITQEIFLDNSGVGADLDRDRHINSEKEAQLIPKKVLNKIGELWYHYTEGKCYWYGSSGDFNDRYFEDDNCQEILGLNSSTLTRLIADPPYSKYFRQRLKESNTNEPVSFRERR